MTFTVVTDCFRRVLGQNLPLLTNSAEEVMFAKFKRHSFQRFTNLNRTTVIKFLKCLKALLGPAFYTFVAQVSRVDQKAFFFVYV